MLERCVILGLISRCFRFDGSDPEDILDSNVDGRTPFGHRVYVRTLTWQSTEVAHLYRRERPDVTDIKFVIRKDQRKLKRVRYLLEMKAEIARVTKYDADEYAANPSG